MHDIDVSAVRLAGLDLNLLVALDALLATRSVTAAARRLGRTQSATSHALQRLRDTLGDELLVRSGRGLVPTPRALALGDEVATAIAAVSRVFTAPAPFDPATSRRELRVAAPDLLAPLLPGLLDRIWADAPGLRVAVATPAEGAGAALAAGSADLAVGLTAGADASLRHRPLGEVRFGVVARANHLIFAGGPLTLAAWTAWPHVVVRSGVRTPNLLQERLDEEGVARTVGLEVPTFLLALHVVARTDLLYAGPVELVADLVAPLGLGVAPLPIAMPPLPVAVSWHPRSQHDAAHAWLRERLAAELASRLVPDPVNVRRPGA